MTLRQTLVLIFGIVFLLIGLLGLVQNPVLGLFAVDGIHNVVHILSGILGIVLSRTTTGAKNYAIGFGIVYGLVTLLGFVMPGHDGELLGIMMINNADNYLHLFLTAALLAIGFAPLDQRTDNRVAA